MGRVTGRECADWQGIMAMDAIGRAGADETRELAEHLAHCDQCRSDAADVKSAAAALTLVDASQFEGLSLGGERPAPAAMEAAVQPTPSIAGGPAAPTPASAPTPTPPSIDEVRVAGRRNRRRRMAGIGAAVVAVAAAVVAVVALSTSPTPPIRTVALTGQAGVVASISLSTQSWGTRATLRESGQAPGQVLTVSMKSSSGRWWMAGSYRTTGRSGTVEVQLSCAAQASQITTVWVSDQAGHRVLDGYVS